MRLDHVRRAIAFGAHPDDVEVGAGGLVAKLTAARAQVTIVVSSIPNDYARRRAEAVAAAAKLGAALVLPPGDETGSRVEDVPMHALVARFERELAAVEPDLVIVHGGHDSHHDHVVVHRAVMAALRRTRCDILAYATRLPAGAQPPPPTCVVDISAVIDAKLAAIAEHTSQFPADFAEKRRDIHRAVGATHGLSYAEVYEVLRIEL
jgi:LmbE family N-acetylglucosaminyl deacetylase